MRGAQLSYALCAMRRVVRVVPVLKSNPVVMKRIRNHLKVYRCSPNTFNQEIIALAHGRLKQNTDVPVWLFHEENKHYSERWQFNVSQMEVNAKDSVTLLRRHIKPYKIKNRKRKVLMDKVYN